MPVVVSRMVQYNGSPVGIDLLGTKLNVIEMLLLSVEVIRYKSITYHTYHHFDMNILV